KAVVDDAGDAALDPADMVEIGDHAVADIADAGREQRQPTRRHVDDLAGKLAAVGQHVAAQQMHLDALEAPALFGGRQNGLFVRQRHLAPNPHPQVSKNPTTDRVNGGLPGLAWNPHDHATCTRGAKAIRLNTISSSGQIASTSAPK